MKIDRLFILSFVAPLMIFMSIIGLIFRKDNKRIFYLPIGLMGVFIISEKNISRRLKRQRISDKIKSYQKFK